MLETIHRVEKAPNKESITLIKLIITADYIYLLNSLQSSAIKDYQPLHNNTLILYIKSLYYSVYKELIKKYR